MSGVDRDDPHAGWDQSSAVGAAIAKAAKKLGDVPASLRHEILEEGLCLQTCT
jgi:hypothetical protein